MAVVFAILFLSLTVLRPWDLFPELARLRMSFWVGNMGLAASGLSFLFRAVEIVRVPEVHTLAAFVIILVLSPALAEGWLGGVMLAFTTFMPSFVGCILILLTVNSFRKVRLIQGVLLTCAMVLVCQVVAAYHFGWNQELFLMAQRLDDLDAFGERVSFGRARALGFLNDPNDLAQFLIAVGPWLWPAWRRGQTLRNLFLVVLPSLPLLYGVFLTRSRGGVLSLLLIIMLRLRERMKAFRNVGPAIVAAGAGMMLLALGVTGGRGMSADDSSAEGRVASWYAGLQMLQSSPVTGVGFGSYVDHHIRAAHNSYIHCFAELGMVGYILWLALLMLIHSRLSALSRAGEESPKLEDIARAADALRFSFYGFLTGAFFLSRTYTPTLYFLVGLAIALDLAARREGHSARTAGVIAIYARTVVLACASVVGFSLLIRVL